MAKAGEPPLQMTCKRYRSPSCSQDGLTLLFTHCVGSHKEQWEPTIECLFALQDENLKAPFQRVREAWSCDWPSHGEAALLNAEVLESRGQYISAFEWIPPIIALLKSPLLQGHRIVGIGHSAGANSITIPMKAFPEQSPPYVSLILVEPTSISLERYFREVEVHELKTQQRTEATSSRRDTWVSRSEAYSWLQKRFPWKLWENRVLRTYVDHGMCLNGALVSLKCPKKVEARTYPDVEPLWAATSILGQYRSRIPIHMIFGTRNDFVSRSHQDDLCRITADGYQRKVIRISDAGHLIVQEKPVEVARAIWEAIDISAKSHL